MNRELREAAERLLNPTVTATCVEGGTAEWKLDIYYYQLRELANAVLSMHLPDDDEPVTSEWVRSIAPRYWDAGKESYWPDLSLRFAEKIGKSEGGFYFWGEGERSVMQEVYYLPIKTRGQVRLLLRALQP